MIKLKPADFIGYTRSGAVVLRTDHPLFIVRCKCGAEFRAGREKLRDSCRSYLRCNACRHEDMVAAGRRAHPKGSGN